MGASTQEKICVVIGGFGFIGSAIAHEAEQQGFTTHRVGRENYQRLKGLSSDVLINANGNSKKYLSTRDPALDFELSVQSVAQVLQDFPAKKVVHLSSIDVYPVKDDPAQNHEASIIQPDQLSPYGFHKYMAEQLVSYWSEDWLVLRLGGFIGPGLKKNSIYDLLKGEGLYVHPDSKYQYQDTRVFARRVFQLIEQNRTQEVINVGGDGVVSLRTLAALVPGQNPETLDGEGTAEHYEVNLDKLHSYLPPASTHEAAEQFIKEALANPKLLS